MLHAADSAVQSVQSVQPSVLCSRCIPRLHCGEALQETAVHISQHRLGKWGNCINRINSTNDMINETNDMINEKNMFE
jgi:hypothetical protein